VLSAAALGFLLGLRHAFDPDHVLAVGALVARNESPWRATWIGATWGLGHTLTLLAVGAVVIALRVAVPQSIALVLELCVGLVLIALGAGNLLAARAAPVCAGAERGPAPPLRAALARSGLVGTAHGLAGSAAVALLALAAMPTTATALVYLSVFGLGTVVGMVGFSLAIGAPFALLGTGPRMRRWITAGTGAASLLFGAYVVYDITLFWGLPGPA